MVDPKTNLLVGGHALCIVGYDDDLGGFIVENSWGRHWGDNGFFLLKYDVALHDIFDAWVCTKFWDIAFKPEWERGYPLTNYDTIELNVNYYTDLDEQHRLKLTCTVDGGIKPFKYTWKFVKGILIYYDELEPINNGKECYVKIGKTSDKSMQWIYKCIVEDSGDPPYRVVQYFKINVDYTKPSKPKPIKPKKDNEDDNNFAFILNFFKNLFESIFKIFKRR